MNIEPEQFRKPDQYYADQYDRATIRELKRLEKEAEENEYPLVLKNFGRSTIRKYHLLSKLYDTAVNRAQSRENTIRQWQEEDERKDKLVQRNPVPKSIKCNTCNAEMFLCSHMFERNDAAILFVFECRKGHAPRRLIHPDGTEHIIRKRRCNSCNYELETTSERKARKIIVIDTCSGCGKVTIDELEFHKKPELIKEDDRKRYCLDFLGKQTILQDLKSIYALSEFIKLDTSEKQAKEESGFDKVERVNVPQMEDRLIKLCEEIGYTKFKFETPASGRFLTVRFSAQDPSNRTEQESIKKLTKAIKACVFSTNWRLVTTGITYQLGFLTGQLKAYTADEDIMKIGRGIK